MELEHLSSFIRPHMCRVEARASATTAACSPFIPVHVYQIHKYFPKRRIFWQTTRLVVVVVPFPPQQHRYQLLFPCTATTPPLSFFESSFAKQLVFNPVSIEF